MKLFWGKSFAVVLLALLSAAAPASAAPGDLDRRFGVNGKLRLGPVAHQPSVSGFRQSNGRILISSDLRLRGFTARGRVDRTFGHNGVLVFQRLPDKVIGGGPADSFYVLTTEQNGDKRLDAFDANGQVLKSFGTAGRVDLSEMYPGVSFASVAIHRDGLVLASEVEIAATASTGTAIARLTSSGSVDTSFGVEGVATIVSGDGSSLCVLPDGSLIAGTTTGIVKLTPSAAIDTSFGEAGRVSLVSQGGSRVSLSTLPQTDGGLVVFETRMFSGRGASSRTDGQRFSSTGTPVGRPFLDVGQSAAAFADGSLVTIGSDRGFAQLTYLENDLSGRFYKTPISFGTTNTPVDILPLTGRDALAIGIGCALDCAVVVNKVIGTRGSDVAPVPWLQFPRSQSYRSRPVARVFGSARPVGRVARVLIAVHARNGADCRWLSMKAKRFVTRRTRRNCDQPLWNKATGRRAWFLKLPKRLPPGQYEVYARAVRSDGKLNPITRDSDSFSSVTVLPRRR